MATLIESQLIHDDLERSVHVYLTEFIFNSIISLKMCLVECVKKMEYENIKQRYTINEFGDKKKIVLV